MLLISSEYAILFCRMLDPVVAGFQKLLDTGQLQHEHFFYKLIKGSIGATEATSGSKLRWASEIYSWLQSIKHTNSEKALAFLRGGDFESKEALHLDFAKMNIPLPSIRSVRQKEPAYTTQPGVELCALKAFLKLASHNGRLKALVQNDMIAAYPVVFQRDGLALKPALQLDPASGKYVGGKQDVDVKYMEEHPTPTAADVKDLLHVEADQGFIGSLCGELALPVLTDFSGRSKTKEEVRDNVLHRCIQLQVCLRCLTTGTVASCGGVISDSGKDCTSECKGLFGSQGIESLRLCRLSR